MTDAPVEHDRIEPVELQDEMQRSYIDYAMKKLLILAAAAAGIAWFIKQKQAPAPADTWSKASDPV